MMFVVRILGQKNMLGQLLKMSSGNKYVLIVIDHNSKWCETHPMKSHDVMTTTQFLEEEIIYADLVCLNIFSLIMAMNG
jgi:hypothetical protein